MLTYNFLTLFLVFVTILKCIVHRYCTRYIKNSLSCINNFCLIDFLSHKQNGILYPFLCFSLSERLLLLSNCIYKFLCGGNLFFFCVFLYLNYAGKKKVFIHCDICVGTFRTWVLFKFLLLGIHKYWYLVRL